MIVRRALRPHMCERCDQAPGAPVPRRALLGAGLLAPVLGWASTNSDAGAAVGAGAVVASSRAGVVARAARPPIVPRSEWGGDLLPKGTLLAEDVRFLLVHHTAEPGSGYAPDRVRPMLRSIYQFHTGPSKGWPDVAYNFFVDTYGVIYEGRTGSLSGAVRGSATGGNQGYSQLCCFIGDFTAAPPPEPALRAMYDLLAWLADRHGVDTSPGATATFTSLGSNRHPAGTAVTTPTIAGHRDMSATTCPGEACYRLLGTTFPAAVSARRGAPVPPAPPSSAAPPPPAAPTTDPPPAAPTTAAPPSTTSSTTTPAATTEVPATTTSTTTASTTTVRSGGEERAAAPSTDPAGGPPWGAVAGVGALGAALATGLALRRRGEPPPEVE